VGEAGDKERKGVVKKVREGKERALNLLSNKQTFKC